MGLQNRVALITGGSRGIGRGIALRLGQEGARVAIAYRSNKVAAQQTLRQLQSVGVDCVAVETDITVAAVKTATGATIISGPDPTSPTGMKVLADADFLTDLETEHREELVGDRSRRP